MSVVAGERRIVTVLFADIVGSTAIGERLGPERFTLLVGEVMRVMSAEVERFDGTVVQYVGDELYAVFGAPVAHEDDSQRAVLSALAIQRALGEYAADVEPPTTSIWPSASRSTPVPSSSGRRATTPTTRSATRSTWPRGSRSWSRAARS